MEASKRIAILLAAVMLAGCSTLIPKKVELFQDKVKSFPEPSFSELEPQRQAALMAHEKAVQVVDAALAEQSSTNVVRPARQVERLTGAMTVAAGPPKKPATVEPEALASQVLSGVNAQNKRVEDFKKQNDENAGKKIEGTGLIQVSYIWWVGGIAALVFVLFTGAKLVLTILSAANPAASIGLNVMNAAQSVVTKGFSQLVQGGENFKDWVNKEIQDEGLRDKILKAFQSQHKQAQDSDVQRTVENITR